MDLGNRRESLAARSGGSVCGPRGTRGEVETSAPSRRAKIPRESTLLRPQESARHAAKAPRGGSQTFRQDRKATRRSKRGLILQRASIPRLAQARGTSRQASRPGSRACRPRRRRRFTCSPCLLNGSHGSASAPPPTASAPPPTAPSRRGSLRRRQGSRHRREGWSRHRQGSRRRRPGSGSAGITAALRPR